MALDPIQRLAKVGVPIEQLSDEQRTILGGLSDQEVDILTSVKARLDAVSGEVEGQDASIFTFA